ncbi:MAG: hypothetical protein RSF78_10190 [Bacteroidales bacterium]
MKNSERIEMDRKGNSGQLYQIGLPAAKLSTVFMLWVSYERPCKIVVHPSKKQDDWAVIEIRHDIVAAEIISLVTEARVNIIKDQPQKQIIL